MVAVNPPTVMGPGDARMSVGVLFREVAKRRVPRVSRGGFTVCDVRDVARGHVLAFEKGRPGERYITGGTDVRPAELMERIASSLDVEPARMRVPVFAVGMGARALRLLERLGLRASAAAAHVWLSTRWVFHSSEKARRELGYATLPLDDCLEDSIRWYREKGLV
ncbi:MAG: hypothetical protein HY720_24170 [Planctomycetes bacterium]|nr:hypothetical protein [Planctomycetota bacterium]